VIILTGSDLDRFVHSQKKEVDQEEKLSIDNLAVILFKFPNQIHYFA